VQILKHWDVISAWDCVVGVIMVVRFDSNVRDWTAVNVLLMGWGESAVRSSVGQYASVC
jgi:hypothetical protein